MIPGSANALLLASAAPTGYNVERSLRFNSSDSAYLSRTPSTAGNRKTWTWAGWVKRATVTASDLDCFFACVISASDYVQIAFQPTSNYLGLYIANPSGTSQSFSASTYRDLSAWYHIVISFDSTQATPSNRLKAFVNGTEITYSTDARSSIVQNTDFAVNSTNQHVISSYLPYASGRYFNGYLADVIFVDGQALTPSSFTEVSATTGQLIPKAYTGTYGTNGFHLPFSDNSTAAALGTDTSGNGNDWTVNNISVTATDRIYAGNASAAVGGVVPNGGTPYWVDILPTNADLEYYGGSGLDVVHDGNLATYVYWVGDDYAGGNVTRARFDLRDFPTVTSVRLYAEQPFTGSPYTPYSARLLDSSKNAISGTNITINNASPQWLTVPVSGSPAFIEFYRESPNAERLNLHAIEVNGQALVNGLGKDNDSLVDTPTSYGVDAGNGGEVRGNYCTWNPLDRQSAITLSNGNLEATKASNTWSGTKGTVGVSLGKWYAELTCGPTGNISDIFFGVCASTVNVINPASNIQDDTTERAKGMLIFCDDGRYQLDANARTSYSSSLAVNDVLGIAYNLDNNTVQFYKNGSALGSIDISSSPLASATIVPFFVAYYTGAIWFFNFGQRPFAYTAPSGYKALCTTNLPAPVVAQPSTVMDVKLYTGNGSTQTISGLGFSPDFVWLKSRGTAYNHQLFDTIRGTGKQLLSSSTSAELTQSFSWLNSFNSNGFGVTGTAGVNDFNDPMVAWCFDAGSNTVSNTAGSITSSVRANASAGFSIVTFTGTGANATVGHGLGVAPGLVIVKCRSAANDWGVYHSANTSDPKTDYLLLNSTAATADDNTYWNDTAPTSTVFSIGTNADVNTNTATYVAYCFASVDGYSNGFSYTGNGSTDGSFVYLGFRPRLILLKCSSTTGNWTLLDTAREGYNVDNDPLYPNLSSAEGTTDLLDITSNGFKLRTTDASVNSSGATYVGYAWAEAPFAYARAR